jgi:transposase
VHLENIIKKTIGIKDHRIVTIDSSTTENIVVHIDVIKRRQLPCGQCGTRARVVDRVRNERTFLHVPLWGIPVFLRYWPRRVKCPDCGIRREQLPWADGKEQMTKQLAVTIAIWAKVLAVDVVATMFGVHWNTVYAAVNKAVSYGLAHRKFGPILYIGVDEISRKKGHKYMTLVYDLEKKRLLWSGKDRKEETLRQFFETHGEQLRSTVVGVCCDMWAPYIKVIKEYLPDAVLVFDRFHLTRHLLNAVDTVRKDEARELKKTNPDLLKGTKYVFLKNPENLTDTQRERLSRIEKLNLRINRAYLLKEEFKELFRHRSKDKAEKFLKRWTRRAMYSRLQPLKKFVRMLRKHWDGVLAWVTVPISNGVVEAMNNNAKAISHRARGFASYETFACILMHCLADLPTQEMAHSFV